MTQTIDSASENEVFAGMAEIDTVITKLPVNVACPALMMMAAWAVARYTVETDEYLVEQFRLCLIDARIQPEGAPQ